MKEGRKDGVWCMVSTVGKLRVKGSNNNDEGKRLEHKIGVTDRIPIYC